MFWIRTPRRGPRPKEISPRLGKPSAEPPLVGPLVLGLVLTPGTLPREGKPSPREGQPLLEEAKSPLEEEKSNSPLPLEEVLLVLWGVGSWEWGGWGWVGVCQYSTRTRRHGADKQPQAAAARREQRTRERRGLSGGLS